MLQGLDGLAGIVIAANRLDEGQRERTRLLRPLFRQGVVGVGSAGENAGRLGDGGEDQRTLGTILIFKIYLTVWPYQNYLIWTLAFASMRYVYIYIFKF